MNDSACPGRWPPAGSGGEAGVPRAGANFATVLDGFTLESGHRKPRWRGGADRRTQPSPGRPRQGGQPEPRPPQPRTGSASPAPGRQQPAGADLDELADVAALVRPYQWTGGRTRAAIHLGMETLVSTSERGTDEGALTCLEHRTVAELCRHPHAVAEVAAKLSVPLGVVRVLLSDMAEQGLITVHRTVADDDMAAHLVLMERVLSGLRRL